MVKCRREGFIEEGIPELSFEGKLRSDGMGKHFRAIKTTFTKLDYKGERTKLDCGYFGQNGV